MSNVIGMQSLPYLYAVARLVLIGAHLLSLAAGGQSCRSCGRTGHT